MMQFLLNIYVLPLLVAALVAAGVSVFLWRRRHTPGATSLALVAALIVPWSVGYALEIGLPTLQDKIFWGKVQYLGIALVGYLWMIFSLAYTSQGRSRILGWVYWLAPLPITTIVLIFTTELHGLMWSEMKVESHGAFSVLGVTHGGWFWVHFAYSYLFLMLGVGIILVSLRRMQGLYRWQVVALVVAALSPIVGNLLYFIFDVSPDPTPYAFTITVIALAWGIFGYRLGDVSPIARDLVIEAMRDGMIVLDLRGRVVDMNGAAGRMIGVHPGQAIGKSVDEVFTPWPHLIARFREGLELTTEFSVGEGLSQRKYGIQISVLYDQHKNPIGRVITTRSAEASLPPPRFAVREEATRPLEADESSLLQEPVVPEAENSLWDRLVHFFVPPLKKDVVVPNDVNPTWTRTIEQVFTSAMRFIAVLGTITLLLISYPWYPLLQGFNFHHIIAIVLILVWVMALARNFHFYWRVGSFVLVAYVLGFFETINYGYSAESFTFFLTFIIMAVLLVGLRAGVWAFVVSMLTLAALGWLIGSGQHVPFSMRVGDTIVPASPTNAIIRVVGFAAISASVFTAIAILLRSLNLAWQKETQALNLFQQERDLLEQRVAERTADLAAARDQAVQSSIQLRKYFQAIEQSGNTIVITDTQGRIEYANPRFEETSGYSVREAVGQNMRLLKSGTQSGAFYETMWKTIGSGQVWQGELHNRRKDGSLYWEVATIAPVHNQDGTITNYVAIKEDITANKEIRETLARQNQYLATLQNITLELLNRRDPQELLNNILDRSRNLMNAPLGAVLLLEDGKLVYRAVTEARTHLLGKSASREELKLGWQAFETSQTVIVDDYLDREGIYRIDAQTVLHAAADFPILAGGRSLGVIALGRTEPGQPFTPSQIELGQALAQIAALVLDNVKLYDDALREIEERKHAEERVQQFLDDMKSLQEVHLALSQVEDAQELYQQMIGLSQRRLGLDRIGLTILSDDGTTLHGTYGVDLDGHLRDERNYREAITPGHWTYEVIRMPNHTIMWNDAPLYDDDGVRTVGAGWKIGAALWNGQRAVGFLVCDTLLSKRPPRPYELELLSLLGSTFGHLVERKKAEEQLSAARDQALDASRFKSQLLAKVSHELRTPLGGVIGYAELLQQHVFGALDDEQREAVDNIVVSANYLNIMINELLDEAQIEARAVKMYFAPFSPANLLQKASVNMTVLALNKGLHLRTTLDANLPETLLGDERRLIQILINLTGNAIKFTTKGEVTMRIHPYDSAHWAMSVSDTGAGIPPEAQAYIFDPFRQVDNAITRDNRGTGLGLSITRQLAELMGGRIELKSEVGQGSTFTVILPLQPEIEKTE